MNPQLKISKQILIQTVWKLNLHPIKCHYPAKVNKPPKSQISGQQDTANGNLSLLITWSIRLLHSAILQISPLFSGSQKMVRWNPLASVLNTIISNIILIQRILCIKKILCHKKRSSQFLEKWYHMYHNCACMRYVVASFSFVHSWPCHLSLRALFLL